MIKVRRQKVCRVIEETKVPTDQNCPHIKSAHISKLPTYQKCHISKVPHIKIAYQLTAEALARLVRWSEVWTQLMHVAPTQEECPQQWDMQEHLQSNNARMW